MPRINGKESEAVASADQVFWTATLTSPPWDLIAQDHSLWSISSRTSLRRVLRRWLQERRSVFYSHIVLGSQIDALVGKPLAIRVSDAQLDRIVTEAAIQLSWMMQRTKRSRFDDRLAKAKAAWKADPDGNPGPDERFGIAIEVYDPRSVIVEGTGSSEGDDLARIAALKLAETYELALAFEKERAQNRIDHERDCVCYEILETVMRGKSATPLITRRGRILAVTGQPAKARRTVRPDARAKGIVSPPPHSATASTPTSNRRWRDLSLETKAGLMASAIEREGRGLSFTIKLSDETVMAAQKARKGCASHLRERFAKLLKRKLGETPEMLIILEQGLYQRPHLHGVVDLPDTEANRRAVRSAGEVLSSLKLNGSSRPRIVDIQPLRNGAFWPGDYTAKYRRTTKRQLAVKRVMAHTTGLRNRALVLNGSSAP